jgi:hypothetical protein
VGVHYFFDLRRRVYADARWVAETEKDGVGGGGSVDQQQQMVFSSSPSSCCSTSVPSSSSTGFSRRSSPLWTLLPAVFRLPPSPSGCGLWRRCSFCRQRRRRRGGRACVLYTSAVLLAVIAFFGVWLLFTLLILFAQERVKY